MQITRKEILDILRREGEATVDLLARQLALTSTCVRQHLSVLERDQLIKCREVRQKLGRPQFVYTLTASADDLFPKSYHLLTTWLLDELKAVDGSKKALQVMQGMAVRWAETIAPQVAGQTIQEKVAGLVSLLRKEGHLVEWEQSDEGLFIHEYDCRFQRVAQAHPEVCVLECTMLTRVLGTPVQALECLMDGKGRCTYCVATCRQSS